MCLLYLYSIIHNIYIYIIYLYMLLIFINIILQYRLTYLFIFDKYIIMYIVAQYLIF
jgi:hypothetical protein